MIVLSYNNSNMTHNSYYFIKTYGCEFVRQSDKIVEVLDERLLPCFGNLQEESDEVMQKSLNQRAATSIAEDGDYATCAEWALDEGVMHYELMSGIRQGIINLFAVALYHLLEQQVFIFHCDHFSSVAMGGRESNISLDEFKKKLNKNTGVNIGQFGCWEKLAELKQLANVIKHAEGPAAKKLRRNWKVSFMDILEPLHKKDLYLSPHVLQPLLGRDVIVSLDKIKTYQYAMRKFWLKELPDALMNAD